MGPVGDFLEYTLPEPNSSPMKIVFLEKKKSNLEAWSIFRTQTQLVRFREGIHIIYYIIYQVLQSDLVWTHKSISDLFRAENATSIWGIKRSL